MALVEIPDTEIDQDSPVTTALMGKYRANAAEVYREGEKAIISELRNWGGSPLAIARNSDPITFQVNHDPSDFELVKILCSYVRNNRTRLWTAIWLPASTAHSLQIINAAPDVDTGRILFTRVDARTVRLTPGTRPMMLYRAWGEHLDAA